MLKVAVIGGGWAGLAAAVELSRAGVDVCVFEAAKQLGGRARSVEFDGRMLDNGQHILVGAYRETLRLMQVVGANADHLLRRMPLQLEFPGSQPAFNLRLPRLPAPLHLAFGLFSARGASLPEKFSAARFMRVLQACNYQLAADCSVSDLLDRHAQHGRLRQHLWEPLCLAALNTAAFKASAQIFANVLRDSLGGARAETDLLLPAADLGQLFPYPAADFIRASGGKIQLSTRIENLEYGLHINGQTYDHAVVAVAPQHAAKLLASWPACAGLNEIASRLAGYTYEPIATVYTGYPPEVRLPFPMLGLNGDTQGKLGQWVFDRGQLGAPPGTLAFVLSADGNWDRQENATLAEGLHVELQAALRKILPPAHWYRVIRERRATFSCTPGLARPTTETACHGLWLAGDHVCASYPATLEGAVRSGVAAAHAILSSARA